MGPFHKPFSQPFRKAVIFAGMIFILSGPAWSKWADTYPPCSVRPSIPFTDSSRVNVSRKQQAPTETEEDTQRNWKTFQGLSPAEKAGLKNKSQKWQSLPPDQQNEMRRRMEKYKELPPQDQERYQKRYQQWQSLPPEDRNRIRERLRNWDSLSPQEQEEVLQRFQKR